MRGSSGSLSLTGIRWVESRGQDSPCANGRRLALRPEAPRLLLVSPSLEFHPATETLLSYFSPLIEVERIGLGADWRKGLRVMFRLMGAERPR